MAKKGGYSILDLTSETIYKDALALANVDKPILIYPENDKPVFADTFAIDTDNDLVIITIGGVTITIADDNTITTSGDIQNHLYLHTLKYYDLALLEIQNTQSTMTYDDICNYLANLGYTTLSNEYKIYSGNSGPGTCSIFGLNVSTSPSNLLHRITLNDDGTSSIIDISSSDVTITSTKLF